MQFLPVLAALDADKNGEISAEEIDNAAAALKKLDKNGDGYLTRLEFGYNRQSSQAAAEFDRLDTNKDGRVSRSEYK